MVNYFSPSPQPSPVRDCVTIIFYVISTAGRNLDSNNFKVLRFTLNNLKVTMGALRLTYPFALLRASVHRNDIFAIVTQFLSRELIAALPEYRNVSLEKDLFPTLVGKDFFAFPQEGKFIDIGTPNSYKKAETFFTKTDKLIDTEKSMIDKK